MGSYGECLKVNGKSYFSRSVSVGNHCNFNGMIASGGAKYPLETIFIRELIV